VNGELAKAICRVMGTVRSVPETGYNQHGRYKYASDADLLGALQPAMAEAGLALVPRAVASTTVPHGESKAGNAKWRTDLVVTYDLLHVSGESTQVQAPGCGIDGDDKGTYKAMTGALKYALRHLFLVPTGEDAERDRSDRSSSSNDRSESRDSGSHEEPRQADQPFDAKAVDAELRKAGLDIDLANWWGRTYATSKKTLAELDPRDRAAALGWLTSPEGREKVLAELHNVREELRRAFFAKWGLLYPSPRKRDGVSEAEIERAEAAAEADRRRVMRAWYGVESTKEVGIRAALKGDHSIDWLREVDGPGFEAAVNEALEPGSEAA
jgi:hypothetical protein